MPTRTKMLSLLLFPMFGIFSICNASAAQPDSIELYTPYTKITVPPGEPIEYPVDIINNSKEIRTVEISLAGLPRDWNYTLKSGNWNIRQLSILPGTKQSFSLKLDVPFKVDKGSYHFRIMAGESIALPMVVIVSEKGTFKTEFTSLQTNMEGHSNSNFTFTANLVNRTAEKQVYALMANAPRGWNVVFKANYQQVASVAVDPSTTQNITIELKPPENTEAGKYRIPVTASTSSTSGDLELEVVITGSFGMELSTPTGLLSASITRGEEKRIDLVVTNTGSSELTDIDLTPAAPLNWDVKFDPKKIAKLQPGKATTVSATIKTDKKAIPGDYVTNIEAKTTESSAKTSLRITVETPLVYGWIGILIIILALGSVYYLFRKYGRR